MDNAATTKPSTKAVAAALSLMQDNFHNPSSLYTPALRARKAIEACRNQIKDLLHAHSLVFTSGGTEANNLGILGGLAKAGKRGGRVLFSAIEHAAVRKACEQLGERFEVMGMPVTQDGVLDLHAAEKLMTADTVMICVMQVNNEVGSIQPLSEIIGIRNRLCPDALMHVDGVQGFLRIPVDMRSGIDCYALSAHKVHGLKGTGALALSPRVRVQPLLAGGGQENGLRSGTENTPGIAALSAAILDYAPQDSIRHLKNRLKSELLLAIPEAVVNGPDPESAISCGHILNISFPPVRAQTMMHALEGEGILVSQGSACSSKSPKPSHSLMAMGVPRERADSALRFSLSRYTTREEIDATVSACAKAYQSLRRFTRR